MPLVDILRAELALGNATANSGTNQPFKDFLVKVFLDDFTGNHSQKDALRTSLVKALDPREKEIFLRGLDSLPRLEGFFDALKDFIKVKRLELHVWVLPTFAAMAIEGAYQSSLAYWLYGAQAVAKPPTGGDVESVIRGSVSAAVDMIGRSIQP